MEDQISIEVQINMVVFLALDRSHNQQQDLLLIQGQAAMLYHQMV